MVKAGLQLGPRQHVALYRVKTRGHQDQVGLEVAQRGEDYTIKCRTVLGVAGLVIGPRDVDVAPTPQTQAGVAEAFAGSSRKRGLVTPPFFTPRPGDMQGNGQYTGVTVKSLLCTVAMMVVPIYDSHPGQLQDIAGISSSDSRVVKEAKAAGLVARVVSGRPHDSKRPAQVGAPSQRTARLGTQIKECFDGTNGPADRLQHSLERPRAVEEVLIGIAFFALRVFLVGGEWVEGCLQRLSLSAHTSDVCNMRLRVYQQELPVGEQQRHIELEGRKEGFEFAKRFPNGKKTIKKRKEEVQRHIGLERRKERRGF